MCDPLHVWRRLPFWLGHGRTAVSEVEELHWVPHGSYMKPSFPRAASTSAQYKCPLAIISIKPRWLTLFAFPGSRAALREGVPEVDPAVLSMVTHDRDHPSVELGLLVDRLRPAAVPNAGLPDEDEPPPPPLPKEPPLAGRTPCGNKETGRK